MKPLLTTAAVLVALVNPAAAQVKDDAFIFGSNSIVSALDAKQSIRLGERLTLAQIKKRLPSYAVKRSNACEGSCIHVSGRNGIYLELNYNTPGEPISYISGFLVGARDTLRSRRRHVSDQGNRLEQGNLRFGDDNDLCIEVDQEPVPRGQRG